MVLISSVRAILPKGTTPTGSPRCEGHRPLTNRQTVLLVDRQVRSGVGKTEDSVRCRGRRDLCYSRLPRVFSLRQGHGACGGDWSEGWTLVSAPRMAGWLVWAACTLLRGEGTGLPLCTHGARHRALACSVVLNSEMAGTGVFFAARPGNLTQGNPEVLFNPATSFCIVLAGK